MLLSAISSLQSVERVVDDRGQRHRRVVGEHALLSVGERQEALEQPVRLVESLAQLGVERANLRWNRLGLGDGDVE